MTAFVALLRAVNVGGTGKLPMKDLKRLCEAAGLEAVQTYIASGNVVFRSGRPASEIKVALEGELRAWAGKPIGVLVRTAADISDVLAKNPFPTADPSRTAAIFLDGPPGRDAMAGVAGLNGEEVRVGAREIYVSYGENMARSKLRIPAARNGTARNMSTIAKLAALAADSERAD